MVGSIMEKSFNELSKKEHIELMKNDAEGWIRSLQESLDLRRVDEEVEGPVEGPHDLEVKLVQRIGGREGEGSHAERTYAVTDGSEIYFYFKIIGYYDSYEGAEWDDYFIVKPVEVTVIQYHPI